jgi:hypothetical protein
MEEKWVWTLRQKTKCCFVEGITCCTTPHKRKTPVSVTKPQAALSKTQMVSFLHWQLALITQCVGLGIISKSTAQSDFWSIAYLSSLVTINHWGLRLKYYGHDGVPHSRELLTFRRNFLPPSSEHKESTRGQGIKDPKMGSTSYFEMLVNIHSVSWQRKPVHITEDFKTRTDVRRIEFLYTQCGAERIFGHSWVNLLEVYKLGFACVRIRVTAQPISHALCLK